MRRELQAGSSISAAATQIGWHFLPAAAVDTFALGLVETGPDPGSLPARGIRIGQAVLYGPGTAQLRLEDAEIHQSGEVTLFRSGAMTSGFAQVPVTAETLEATTYDVYRTLVELVGDRAFCRFWNYVPNINHVSGPLIENYRLFCSGRARAFLERFGEHREEAFSAASATGSRDGCLSVVFLAASATVRNWENPEQVPAYEYPTRYGPKPPSFARGSACRLQDGREWVFISGTSAIKGHSTQHQGDCRRQIEVTLSNLDIALSRNGLRLREWEAARPRQFMAYLRNRAHLDQLLHALEPCIGPADTVSVVEADICRKDLEVEIEVTIPPAQEA